MNDFNPQITFGIIAEYAPEEPEQLPVIRDKNISELHKASIIPIEKLLNKMDSLAYYQDHWQSMVIQEIGCCECSGCLKERANILEMLELEVSQSAKYEPGVDEHYCPCCDSYSVFYDEDEGIWLCDNCDEWDDD